jgi:hypothetical protein
MLLKEDFNFLYAALWKQRTETKDCSHLFGRLRASTSIQRSKTHVYALTLICRNETQIRKYLNAFPKVVGPF